jgi:hypothetical protein
VRRAAHATHRTWIRRSRCVLQWVHMLATSTDETSAASAADPAVPIWPGGERIARSANHSHHLVAVTIGRTPTASCCLRPTHRDHP